MKGLSIENIRIAVVVGTGEINKIHSKISRQESELFEAVVSAMFRFNRQRGNGATVQEEIESSRPSTA